MEQQFKEFKDCTEKLINAVHEIDKKLAVSIQQTEDFFKNNTNEHHTLTASVKDNTILLGEHNGRLRKLEKWKWAFTGGLAVVVFLIGWIWDIIKDKI